MILSVIEIESIKAWSKQFIDAFTELEIGPYHKNFKNSICSAFNMILSDLGIPCENFECSLALEFITLHAYRFFLKNKECLTCKIDVDVFSENLSEFLITVIDDRLRKEAYWNVIKDKGITDSVEKIMSCYIKKTTTEQKNILADILLKDNVKRCSKCA